MIQFQKQRYPCKSSSESGYTIIEGLVAIIVVAVMMTAVSPMIVWSVATRMQAKRVQLASQAASTYLAAVRSTSDKPDPDNLTPKQTADFVPTSGDLTDKCEERDGYCTETDRKLYCVNFDAADGCQTDSLVDMVIQPVMDVRIDPNTNEPQTSEGYYLEIRVYRANAFTTGTTLETDEIDSTRVASNNGGIALIGRRNLPLTKMRTFISPTGSNNDLYDSMCRKLEGCGR